MVQVARWWVGGVVQDCWVIREGCEVVEGMRWLGGVSARVVGGRRM